MKRLLAMLLALTTVFSLAACKSKKKSAENTEPTATTVPLDRAGKVVGICLPDSTWELSGTSLKKRLESLDYEVVLEYAEGSADTQANQIKAMVDSPVDCLVVSAVDAIALIDAANYAVSSGIPVVAYDQLLTDTDAVNFYVAPHYYAMGQNIAEYIESRLDLQSAAVEDRSYTIELFMDVPTNTNSVLFYDGVLSVLQTYYSNGVLQNLSGRLDFEDVCVADGTAATADSLCSGRISNYYRLTQLDICIAGSDTIAQGIISSLENYSYTKSNWPIITGYGCTAPSLIGNKLAATIHTEQSILSAACVTLVDSAIFGIDPPLENMLTINNNTVTVPTYFCGYLISDESIQEESTGEDEDSEDPQADATEDDAPQMDTTEDDAPPIDPIDDPDVDLDIDPDA